MTLNFKESDVPSQKGKTFLVTGANTGLGFHTTRVLAKQGARVLMGCRNAERAQKAREKILAQHPAAELVYVHLDLGDLESIKKSAGVIEKEERLDGLINNAGIMVPPFEKTKDGFESQFGVNHLGTFALTHHLLDKLKHTKNARIINTSSNAHKMAKRIDWDDLNAEKGYKKLKQYALSKLANLMHVYALERRFRQAGTDTIALAVHPGGSDTELSRHLGSFSKFLMPAARPFLNSAAQGAWPTLLAATSSEVEGGEYFGPKGFMEIKGPATRVDSTSYAKDVSAQEKLWSVSCALTALDP